MMALLVHQERGDFLDPKEPTVSPDRRALPDLQGRTGCLDTLDREEKSGSKGRRVHLAVPELLDLRAQQVRRGLWASGATLDLQAPQESRVWQGRLGRRGPRETQDHQGAPARTDPQD